MATLDVHDYHLPSHIASKSRPHRIATFFLNYAGLLCLIDCIVLPVLITLLRLLDMFPGIHEWEHTFHIVEIVCVVPLGFLSVFVNYSKVKNLRLLVLGLFGISLIVSGHVFLEGWYETICSLLGCAMLISSNHLARRKHGCGHCHDNHFTMVM